ncbi:N-acetyltransferase [Staphylococcus hominis]|uniref:N-acetyltransferase n=2 Tax=Staphylococcus TaxID=1279 RepID=A0A974KXB6_STAHO|nr:GNAT family N-acetyltransferase [Staphylococcus hominis]OFQ11141.1 GNAT family acetyltransferase [Staphylococcus sp. HMSC072E01]MCE4951760.1 GNAT family N-acetyltransferase [Staphylococcus hominis]MCE4976071.1 GNAT family N-acetyltransferase [Staphylococcus hominis]PTK20643.1 N-acetyltransferase [Staphylococcus hominis]
MEMLFIDPEDFNKSYGTIILQSLIQEDKIQYVDVNKDNQHALKFYIKNGFKA